MPNYSLKGLWRNIYAARKEVSRKHYDVVHITGAEHYLIPFLQGQRVIVTVHDLGFYTNHKGNARALWKYFAWIITLKFADRVTFISEKSMQEAKSLVKLKDERLSVIQNAVAPDFVFAPKQPNVINPIILQLGTKPNKNLHNVIRALKDTTYKLRIIGKLSESLEKMLIQNNIDYSSSENLSDSQIIDEYKQCDIVSLPSLYEGFGMPIIEGQAIGRPVLTSNLSPMKEIVGDSAVLVNPSDFDSIRHGFEVILQDWCHWVKKGQSNVQRYSVDIITNNYFQVYLEMLMNKE